MAKLKMHAQQFSSLNGSVEIIVKLLTGELERKHIGSAFKWERELLSSLLFKDSPTTPLGEIIMDKVNNNAEFKQQNSMLLTLLKVYSGGA
jgi:hypothetical protein